MLLDAAAQMDRLYRHQRFFYDFSRKYFLLGRDTLLRRMDVRAGDRVLEVGCGTARNLCILKQLRRSALLFGLDASAEMLATARAKLCQRRLEGSVHLEQGLAEELGHARTFGIDQRFDVIFFSYSLSMIPACVAALNAALASLKPGRSLYIVDFWDQARLPAFFRGALKTWLEWFGVKHRPEVYAYLAELEARGIGELTRESFGRGYAILAEFRKA